MGSPCRPPSHGAIGQAPHRRQRRRDQDTALAIGMATRVARLGREATADFWAVPWARPCLKKAEQSSSDWPTG
jgi:hypothetical protein